MLDEVGCGALTTAATATATEQRQLPESFEKNDRCAYLVDSVALSRSMNPHLLELDPHRYYKLNHKTVKVKTQSLHPPLTQCSGSIHGLCPWTVDVDAVVLLKPRYPKNTRP